MACAAAQRRRNRTPGKAWRQAESQAPTKIVAAREDFQFS